MIFVQVKFSDGSDLPLGYPERCRETETPELVAGFDAVMTPAELEAEKAKFSVEIVVWLRGRPRETATDAGLAQIDAVSLNIMFAQENKIRALQQLPALADVMAYREELKRPLPAAVAAAPAEVEAEAVKKPGRA